MRRVGLVAMFLVATVMFGPIGCRGDTGPAGAAAPPAGSTGLVGDVVVSTPANGKYYATGEKITVTVTTKDSSGTPVGLTPSIFSQARLHIYGPLDQSKTRTAVGLMGVSGDPNASVHDYVKLTDAAPAGTTINLSNNVAVFTSNAVSSEEAGTYRAAVWLVANDLADYDRAFPVAEFQIKTDTVETESVDGTQCAKCHKGADNGQFYFHHVDSGTYGNPSIDNGAIKTCKACHNQDGYANTTDDWVAGRTRAADPLVRRVHGIHMGAELRTPRNTHRMALASATPDVVGGFNPTTAGDPTTTPVRLLHGVTSGAEARVHGSDGSGWFALGHVTGEFVVGETVQVMKITDLTRWSHGNNWPSNRLGTAVIAASTIHGRSGTTSVAVAEGYFAEYTPVEFPPDVRHCTTCHTDDNWKTRPSQASCTSCHDQVWLGSVGATPEGFNNHPGGEIGDIKNGVAGAEHNVALCTTCHSESGTEPISAAHMVPEFVAVDQHTPATQAHTVELAMDPPQPAAGYVAGQTPKVYVTVKDANGVKVDPATITQAAWQGMTLFVSGPRTGLATPVLTTAAKGAQASVTNGAAGPWNLSGNPTFSLVINGVAPIVLTAAGGNFANPAAATATEVVTWLNGQAAFNTLAKARVSSGRVNIRNKPGALNSRFEILPSAVTTAMSWSVEVTLGSGFTPGNNLRIPTDAWDTDPKVAWNSVAQRIEYQLDDVAGLKTGTYAIYANGYKTVRPEGFALLTFRVGTATDDKFVATNCADCHGTKHMHLDAGGRHPADFTTDWCKNCHDYQLEGPNSDVWAAYGADPIVKKVHGVHRGKYLAYPDKIYPSNPKWSGIVFPQDIRNCTKCHSSDTTGSWDTAPSRMACGSCHDSDAAEAHMATQTNDPTPVYDPVTKTGGAWSGDEVEACNICHGEGKQYSARTVHNITSPYVPPYLR